MALVDYISSSEDENTTSPQLPAQTNTLKRKSPPTFSLPPLPSKFVDLYASSVRTTTVDDPSLHGGRKRITPHIEGNWPTHIYIEWWPSLSCAEVLTSITSYHSRNLQRKGESLVYSDLGAPLPLHVSLSRSLALRLDNKAAFLERVKREVVKSGVEGCELLPESVKWVGNYERTRWFLVLGLRRPRGDGLNRLLRICNTVAEDFGQPELYGSPPAKEQTPSTPSMGISKERDGKVSGEFDRSEAFHISIAWTLEEPPQIEDGGGQSDDGGGEPDLSVEVKDVKVKCGNFVMSIPLKKG